MINREQVAALRFEMVRHHLSILAGAPVEFLQDSGRTIFPDGLGGFTAYIRRVDTRHVESVPLNFDIENATDEQIVATINAAIAEAIERLKQRAEQELQPK